MDEIEELKALLDLVAPEHTEAAKLRQLHAELKLAAELLLDLYLQNTANGDESQLPTVDIPDSAS